MKICILGSGAWGTALAIQAARAHDVTLWSRSEAAAVDMVRDRENRRYLPGFALAPRIEVSADWQQSIDRADLVVLATPVAGLRQSMRRIVAEPPRSDGAVVWLSKGFEANSGSLAHEIWASEAAAGGGTTRAVGVFSGPSFAQEVAAGLPVALTAASADAALTERLVQAFHHGSMRVYRTSDVAGVEVAGALKNVMAIATGLCDGLQLGANARAALLTRGLAEMTRLGIALGASQETFAGLAGVGDLVLTCTGDLSRNRTVGLRLATGRALADIVDELGHVAEGVPGCRAACERARTVDVDLPICEAVLDVLEQRVSPQRAVQRLLARDPRIES